MASFPTPSLFEHLSSFTTLLFTTSQLVAVSLSKHLHSLALLFCGILLLEHYPLQELTMVLKLIILFFETTLGLMITQFPFILKTCANNLNLEKGLETHGMAFKLGFDLDVFVGNTLLLFCGNYANLIDEEKVFDEMCGRDIVSWNMIIGVFSANGLYLEALDLFCKMNLSSSFKPNLVTVVNVLPVCAGFEDGVTGMRIHCYILKVGLDFQVKVGNALINVYGKCGDLKASASF